MSANNTVSFNYIHLSQELSPAVSNGFKTGIRFMTFNNESQVAALDKLLYDLG